MASPAQWVAGARPRTLTAAIAPVAAGTGVAASAGAFDAARAGLALLVALALQVGVNYSNDYSDGIRGTDDVRVGPVRLVGQRLAPPGQVLTAAIAALGIAAMAGLVLVALAGTWWMIALGAVSIAAAWLYTGGARPYGYAGLGEAFVFVFFGPVAVMGTAYVQMRAGSWLAAAVSIPIGILACLILVANNLRDIPTDREAGKHTLAVRLGDAATRRVFVTGTVISFCFVAAVAIADHPWAALGMLGAVPMSGAVRRVSRGATGHQLIPVLGGTGVALLLTGLGLGVGLALG